MGYYDDWDEGREQVFDEPTPDQINDWNIHNDHQDNNEDEDETRYCDICDKPLPHNCIYSTCQKCEDAYNRANPHPLDIAEREELEDRSAGLEIPWRGEF